MLICGFLWVLMAFGAGHGKLQAQLYAGINMGPIIGRSAELQTLIFPKNEDWIAIQLAGGYTLQGPLFIPRGKDCLSGYKHGGWHVKTGLRNNLTIDHHDNHLFWGGSISYSRQNESATVNTCGEQPGPPVDMDQSIHVIGGAINAGFSWNPMAGKTIYQLFKIDLGLQIGTPIWSSAPILGERTYISGLGYSYIPIRSVHFEAIAIFRWELTKRRYGFFKHKFWKRK